jgi:hypothetical protein
MFVASTLSELEEAIVQQISQFLARGELARQLRDVWEQWDGKPSDGDPVRSLFVNLNEYFDQVETLEDGEDCILLSFCDAKCVPYPSLVSLYKHPTP